MKNASLLVHTGEVSRRWIDRLARHKIPTLGIHPEGGRTADQSLTRLTEQLDTPAYRELLDYAAGQGLRIEYEMHAMRYLLPADLFADHPDWFRMNAAGERVTDLNCCAGNEDALAYIAEQAAALVKRLYRSTDRYFLWLDDAKDAFCHCPRCAALSPSDQQLCVLNRILRRIREDNPRAMLAYLAYFDTITPPVQLQPEEGIFLEYAPYERDFHRPLRQHSQAAPLSALLDCFGRENAKALDYWYDNSLFSHYRKPPAPLTPDIAVMEADAAYYRELGFADIGCFACYLGEDYEALYGEIDIAPFARAVQ